MEEKAKKEREKEVEINYGANFKFQTKKGKDA